MPVGWRIDDQLKSSNLKEDFMKSLPTLGKRCLALVPAILLVLSACGGTTTSGGTSFKGTKKVELSTSLTDRKSVV